jgi:Domain of unknown function (DUF4276)
MTRLLVHVEGETEEGFVNEVLRPHLIGRGYHDVNARLLGNARLRLNRGGIRSWQLVRGEIARHLKGDGGATSTTMVDYYGLPDSWPGRVQAARAASILERPKIIEKAIHDDLSSAMGPTFNAARFVPYLSMHEFEGLLFSDCSAFAKAIGQEGLTASLQEIRDQFETPEDINDSPQSAPSKRVCALMPHYQKPLHGTSAALAIGLDVMCRQCPHFRGRLKQLELHAARR